MEKVWISGICDKCGFCVDREVDADYDYPDPFICFECNQPERSKREDSQRSEFEIRQDEVYLKIMTMC